METDHLPHASGGVHALHRTNGVARIPSPPYSVGRAVRGAVLLAGAIVQAQPRRARASRESGDRTAPEVGVAREQTRR